MGMYIHEREVGAQCTTLLSGNQGFQRKERNVSRKKAKTFGRISQTILRNFAFFRENILGKNEEKLNENFLQNAKCENTKICENHDFYSCNIFLLKRTCGNLCSDSSIFEVLLCHINNLSSFTLINVFEENLISLAIF